jgi:hypothetical protein
MRECLNLCCIAAILGVAILESSCGVTTPKTGSNNCELKPAEIPAGYTAADCSCVKQAVTADAKDPGWERAMEGDGQET